MVTQEQFLSRYYAANRPVPKDKGTGPVGFGYGMNLPEIPMIWRAGCIIRAVFLEEIHKAGLKEVARFWTARYLSEEIILLLEKIQ